MAARSPTASTRPLIAKRLKFAEIAAAAVSVVGIALSSIPVLMVALLMFGVISALFGPIKYGILPDHLERKELPKANAWIESATFAAILGGTIAGGVVSADGIGVAVFGPIMMALAVGCWLVSRYIPSTGSAAPDLVIDKNIFRSTWRQVAELRTDTRIWRAGLMTSWFWLIGAIVLSILPTLVKDSLGGNEMAVTVYLAVFAVSIAIGSAIAAWMSQGRIVLSAGTGRHGAAGAVRPASRLDHLEHARLRPRPKPLAPSSPARTRSVSRSTSPAWPSPAPSSWCRPSPPCRPGRPRRAAPASSLRSASSMPAS